MKIAAVICEYNPMQRGHVYHIEDTKKAAQSDYVVCIMSGNFTQRGEYAVKDKYTRAIWAVKNGADLAVELPPQYVLTAAKYFALGGVKIANLIKGDTLLSFGSECGDLAALKKAAQFKESDDFKNYLQERLKLGNGYAKSYADGVAKYAPEYADIIGSPNNILAIEYLKALEKTNSRLTPYTLKRKGGYHDKSSNEYCSASAVRSMLMDGDMDCVKNSVPPCVAESLDASDAIKIVNAKKSLFSLLKYNATKIDLSKIHGVKEGLENRILSALKSSSDWDSLLSNLSAKRYTDAFLLRTLINSLLANTYDADDLENQEIQYVNALAVSQRGKALLSAFDCRVVTQTYRLPNDSLIPAADELYSAIMGNIPNHMQIV